MPIHMTEEIIPTQEEEKREDEELIQKTERKKERKLIIHKMWLIEEKPFDKKNYKKEIRRLKSIFDIYVGDKEKKLPIIGNKEKINTPIINELTTEDLRIKSLEIIPETEYNYDWLFKAKIDNDEVKEERKKDELNYKIYSTMWGNNDD